MQNPWQNILQNEHVRIFRQDIITDVDRKVVSLVYLPFLNPVATSLYQLFLNALEQQTVSELSHYTIMTLLQITPKQYYESRCRLEAAGLLTTYYKDDAATHRFLHQIHPPVTPFVFFNDPLYSGLLKQHVNEEQFHQLKAQFLLEQVDTNSYQNISQPFSSVFGEHVSYYRDNNGEVLSQDRLGMRLTEESFNWAYFMQLLAPTMIREEHLTPDIKQAIHTAATLYAVTPIQMRNYVYDAYQMGQDTVDKDKLLTLIRKDASRQVVSVAQDSERIVNADKYTQLAQQGYSSDVISLIKKFDETKPVELIKQIKAVKNKRNAGGVVTVEPSELKVIEDLLVVNQLSEPVVNTLLHYVLVVMDNALLNEKFAKTIASDWINRQLVSAEDVMMHLKKRDDHQKTQQKKGSGYATAPKRVVALTPEEKQALTASDKPVSPEEHEQLKKMLETL